MDLSSSPKIRLPHASAGPFWAPLTARHEPAWDEAEAPLRQTPALHEAAALSGRRGIRSFAFVVAALVLGGGVLAVTLIGNRGDCGAACHVVTAAAGPTGEPGVKTADAAPRSDVRMVEGRSVAPGAADGSDGVKADAAAPEALAPAVPHRHHRHHHHYVVPY